MRSRILASYKELLLLIKQLPSRDQQRALQEARETMKAHINESDASKQLDLFKILCSKISFLRVITPRKPGIRTTIGAGHYVLRDGNLVEGSGSIAGTRVADGKISMAEAHDLHHKLLRRQNFGRDPPPYNPNTF